MANEPESTTLMNLSPVEDTNQQSYQFHRRLFSSFKCFTACYCLSNVVITALLSYTVTQITALERQFKLTSYQTGIIVASLDFGFLTTSLFIGYFATKVHIPRSIAIVSLISGLSALECSLPNFIFGTNQETTNDNSSLVGSQSAIGQLCVEGNQTRDAKCMVNEFGDIDTVDGIGKSAGIISFWMIVIGCVVNGITLAPRAPFLITFLDANIDKSRTGFILGITSAFSTVGGVLAFSLAGLFSKIHTSLQGVDILPIHPKWIGAWWLGYVAFGLMAIVTALPLFCFPNDLKKRTFNKKTIEEKAEVRKVISVHSVLKHIKAFIGIIWNLLRNPVFLFMETSAVIFIFGLAGTGAFFPKYLETQYFIPAWKANIIIGGVFMATGVLGSLVGGWITARKSMTPVRNLKYMIIVLLIGSCLDTCGFFLGCDHSQFSNSTIVTPESILACHGNCSCDESTYFPVCGDDVNYLSPCFAGCSYQIGKEYYNCTCVETGVAVDGLCTRDCNVYLITYLVIRSVSSLLSSTGMVPHFMVVIRSVRDEEKAMAVGLASFVVSVLGWLTGPIFFGKLVDKMCMVWDQTCEGNGTCALYDLKQFRYQVHGMSLVTSGTSWCLLVISLYFLKKRQTKTRMEEQREKLAKLIDNGHLSAAL